MRAATARRARFKVRTVSIDSPQIGDLGADEGGVGGWMSGGASERRIECEAPPRPAPSATMYLGRLRPLGGSGGRLVPTWRHQRSSQARSFAAPPQRLWDGGGGVGRPVPTAEEVARSEGIWTGADADAATAVVSACWSVHRDPPSGPKAAYRSVSRPRRERPRAAAKGLKPPNRGRRWPPYILGREDQPKTGSSGRSYGHLAAFPPTMPRSFSSFCFFS